MAFREECDLCGKSIRAVSTKTIKSRREDEAIMCKECSNKQTMLDKFYEKHKKKAVSDVERLIKEAKDQALQEFSDIMFERQEARIRAIEKGLGVGEVESETK